MNVERGKERSKDLLGTDEEQFGEESFAEMERRFAQTRPERRRFFRQFKGKPIPRYPKKDEEE